MVSTRKNGVLYRGMAGFVHSIDSLSSYIGKGAMYLVLLMMGILLYEAIARLIFNHSQLWAVESAQFVMAAYR